MQHSQMFEFEDAWWISLLLPFAAFLTVRTPMQDGFPSPLEFDKRWDFVKNGHFSGTMI